MDLGFANLMAKYVNMHLPEGAPAKVAGDFMPDFLTDPKAPKVSKTPEQQNAALLQMASDIGAVVATGDDEDYYNEDGHDVTEDAENFSEDGHDVTEDAENSYEDEEGG